MVSALRAQLMSRRPAGGSEIGPLDCEEMKTFDALALARSHRIGGRHRQAGEILAEVLRQQPDHPEALHQLGLVAIAAGDRASGFRLLTQILHSHPTHPKVAVTLARLLGELGEIEPAIATYRVALVTESDWPEAAAGLTALFLQEGRASEAAELAGLAWRRRQPAIAARLAHQVLRHDPTQLEANRMAGLAADIDGGSNGAERWFRRLLALRPADGDAIAALAAIDLRRGSKRLRFAECRYRRVAAFDRKSPNAALGLVECLIADRRWSDAERLLVELDQRDPDHRSTLILRARIRLEQGRTDAATTDLRRVLSHDPHDAEACRYLSQAFVQKGLSAPAVALARSQQRARQPNAAWAAVEPWLDTDGAYRSEFSAIGATALSDLRETERAAVVLRRALAAAPAAPELWPLLARSLADLGHAEAAESRLRRANDLRALDAAAAVTWAELLIARGRSDEARRLLDRIAASPSLDPDAALRISRVMASLGEASAAVNILDAVLAIDADNARARDALERLLADRPDAAAAMLQRALSHVARGKHALAEPWFRAASRLRPEADEIAFFLGRSILQQHGSDKPMSQERRDETVDCLTQAGRSSQVSLDMAASAGEFLADLSIYDDGLSAMQRAVDSEFDQPKYHTYMYIFTFLNSCDWPKRTAYIERLTARLRRSIADDRPDFPLNPSHFVFLGVDNELIAESARFFARHCFGSAPKSGRPQPGPSASRPIRVGYLSAFLSQHHIGSGQAPIVKAHDRDRVEVFLYSFERKDPVQDELRRHASAFRMLDGRTPAAMASQIAADGIDILVDLDGYVNGASGFLTMEIMSNRPAPIQTLYHNYVGPSGTDFVDYVIGDSMLFPDGIDAFYTEKLIRLPPCYYPARPLPRSEVATDRTRWGLPESAIVFANFGHFYKIEPHGFDLWMRILKRVPGSVIWLNHRGWPRAAANLRREAEARGVDGARLVFSEMVEKPVHVARLGLADLFLDTPIYSSGVTSIDALWAGLPVLTVAGSTFARRVSASLNAGIDMGEMTCATVEAFEERAVQLVTRPEELRSIKQRLDRHRTTTSLFDPRSLASRLEQAYGLAWRRHKEGLPPAAIVVN
jgi:predicted O-linked N-acetylglucosamine transferase (SPINDLY family)/predicted Zn-dependent protease